MIHWTYDSAFFLSKSTLWVTKVFLILISGLTNDRILSRTISIFSYFESLDYISLIRDLSSDMEWPPDFETLVYVVCPLLNISLYYYSCLWNGVSFLSENFLKLITDADFFRGVSTFMALAAINLNDNCCCWIIIKLLEFLITFSIESAR